MITTKLSLVAVLALVVVRCGSTPIPPTDPGRWDVSKSLVRVYTVDQNTAIEAAHAFAQAQGYTVVGRDERSGGLTVLELYTAGGPEAYDAGNGKRLTFRTSNEGAEATKIEMKVGPAFDRNETIEVMDAYALLLPEGTQRRREH